MRAEMPHKLATIETPALPSELLGPQVREIVSLKEAGNEGQMCAQMARGQSSVTVPGRAVRRPCSGSQPPTT